MLKKQLPLLILLLALLLIVLVFWVYDRKIKQIEKEIHAPTHELKQTAYSFL